MLNVLTGLLESWLIIATTRLLSTPPLRNAPSGTSAMRRLRTASLSVASMRSRASASLMTTLLRKSGFQ